MRCMTQSCTNTEQYQTAFIVSTKNYYSWLMRAFICKFSGKWYLKLRAFNAVLTGLIFIVCWTCLCTGVHRHVQHTGVGVKNSCSLTVTAHFYAQAKNKPVDVSRLHCSCLNLLQLWIFDVTVKLYRPFLSLEETFHTTMKAWNILVKTCCSVIRDGNADPPLKQCHVRQLCDERGAAASSVHFHFW